MPHLQQQQPVFCSLTHVDEVGEVGIGLPFVGFSVFVQACCATVRLESTHCLRKLASPLIERKRADKPFCAGRGVCVAQEVVPFVDI